MSKKVLVPIADGTEELEAVTLIDVLRRADISVTVASVAEQQITASRGVKIVADCLITDCVDETFDLVVLPGGIPGAENLRDSRPLEQILKRQADEKRMIGAICASPAVVLASHGLVKNKRATCYPSFVDQLSGAENVQEAVVVDGLCVTSQGPGTALPFALKLVELLAGEKVSKDVAAAMLV